MKSALIRLIAVAAAVWVTATVLPGVEVSGNVLTYLWIALVFSVVNLVIGSLIKLLTMPLTVITFGVSLFVVNAAMFLLTDYWTDALKIDGFWWALLGSLMVSIATSIITKLLKPIS